MKKKLLTLLLTVASVSGLSAQELSEAKGDVIEISGYNKWSVMARGGVSLLSYSQTPNEAYFKSKNFNMNAGLQVEYTCTSLWGLGLDINMINNNQENYDNTIYGFGLVASVNLSNWLAPNRKCDVFNSYLNFGMGLPLTSWKNASFIDEDEMELGVQKLDDATRLARPYIKPGLAFEFNLGPSISAALYGDAFVGLTRPNNNQNTLCIHPTENGGRVIVMTGLSLRYKFGGRQNIRNYTPSAIKTATPKSDLQEQLDALMEKQAKSDALIKTANDRINSLELENAKLRNDVNRLERDLNNR